MDSISYFRRNKKFRYIKYPNLIKLNKPGEKPDEKPDENLKVKKTDDVACVVPRILNELSIDYTEPVIFNYARYSPNYFRYVDPLSPFFPNYEETLSIDNPYQYCLQYQLFIGNIKFWATEVLFLRLVPSINTDENSTYLIDQIRNEFISFCLNIEKSYIFYNQGKKTCNNMKVPWRSTFNFTVFKCCPYPTFPPDETTVCDEYRESLGTFYPLYQIDQYVLYSLSVNFSSSVNSISPSLNRVGGFLNWDLVIKFMNGEITPDDPQLTQVNFYQIISYTYSLFTFLFSTSNKLLNGLCTGLPKQILDDFFPRSRQLYYYNTYLTWVQSRNKLFGFGDKINSSNGEATNIQIPNNIIINNIL